MAAEKLHWLRRSDVRATSAPALLRDVNMATVDVIVDKLLTLWRIPAVRDYFPAIFALISIVGSGLKELDVVPQTYFSNSRNVVNM